jgi:hypothetical protein
MTDGIPFTDFFEDMMKPGSPNEMAFQIDRTPNPGDPADMTFSQEAVNEIAEQFRLFLMAKALGRTREIGRGPKHVRATVTLDWAPAFDMKNDPTAGPFFQIGDDQGLEPLDGTKRYEWRTP